jgi:hypothetical protein
VGYGGRGGPNVEIEREREREREELLSYNYDKVIS